MTFSESKVLLGKEYLISEMDNRSDHSMKVYVQYVGIDERNFAIPLIEDQVRIHCIVERTEHVYCWYFFETRYRLLPANWTR